MFFRILKESFVRRKARKGLAIFSVTLGIALVTALSSIWLGIGDKLARELRSYGANLVMRPRFDRLPVEVAGVPYGEVMTDRTLDEQSLPRIKEGFWQHNILGFTPFLSSQAVIGGMPVALTGTYFSKQLQTSKGETFEAGAKTVFPYWTIEGDWVSDERDENGALVGKDIAERLGIGVGSEFEVVYEGKKYPLVAKGILTTGGPEEKQIFVRLHWLQSVLALPGRVKQIQVSALTTPENKLYERYQKNPSSMTPEEYDRWYCTPYVSSIAHYLEELFPEAEAYAIRQVAQSEGVVLKRLQALFLFMMVTVLFASGLGVMGTMASSILDRRREVGLLKSLGATPFSLSGLFFAESFLMGLVGGCLGIALGSFLSVFLGRGVFGEAIWPNAILVPFLLGMAEGVAIGGSILAVRYAIRVDPTRVLHEV